jgi:hypothetical protein
VNRDEQFEFLNMFSFRMYVSKSLIICIDLWALPDNIKQRCDAQMLCCDASTVEMTFLTVRFSQSEDPSSSRAKWRLNVDKLVHF